MNFLPLSYFFLSLTWLMVSEPANGLGLKGNPVKIRSYLRSCKFYQF